MKKKIHGEKRYIPLNYNKEEKKMIDVRKKDGNRVEFKTLATAEKFCKEKRVSFMVEETRTVYRITIK